MSGEKARYGGRVHAKQSGSIGRSPFARFNQLNDFPLLTNIEFRSASADAPFIAGCNQAVTGTFAQHGPFEVSGRATRLELG